MFIKKAIFVTLISAFSLFMISCGESTAPQNEADDYSTILLDALDEELSLLQANNQTMDSSDITFALSWHKIKDRFSDDIIVLGNAMAVAHSAEANKPFFAGGGLDMGTVTLTSTQDVFELNPVSGRHNDGIVYLSNLKKKGKHRGRKNSEDFLSTKIDFIAEQQYRFETSGSDAVVPLNVSLTTPAQVLQLSNLTAEQNIPIDQDLQINWTGAAGTAEIVVALLPFHKKDKGRKGWKGSKKGKMAPPFVRLKVDERPAIIIKLDENTGNYTIPAADLQQLKDEVEATAFMLHVGAIDWQNEIISSKNVGKVIRMDDRLVLNIE